jgi:UDP-N-acetylmuramoyl-L-alanyl-D-glutamate--2,6-diaminopimelate ligase
MAMSLAQLCAPWEELSLTGSPETQVEEVIVDSRQARPGTLFVAIAGSTSDGHRYLPAVREAGCEVVMIASHHQGEMNREPADRWPAATIAVPDTRGWPARLARQLHGRPDEDLLVVGVTGTNGKTTVAWLLQSMLESLAGPCGLLGTIRYETGAASQPAPLTTPDGPALYGLLAEMRIHDCRAVSMEISSHALDQERTADLALDLAVLTNLGRDHLDYHRDQAAYLEAKARILDLLRPSHLRGKPAGKVVVNAGDPAFSGLDLEDLSALRYAVVSPAELTGPVDLWVTHAELNLQGSRIEWSHADRGLSLQSRLVGKFNVANLTAALAAGLALGFSAADCCAALAEAPQIPGRMQPFSLPNGAVAVVDYAHTPDALAAVLTAGRELTPGRLSVVFGCGGDRDRGKRPLMGEVAARLADRIWITTDNPRSEDPAAICQAIAAGCQPATPSVARECHTILDRTHAIETALAAAAAGDLVVVAGKGHEDYQLVGDERRHLDDSEIIQDWIAARGRDG